MRAYSASSVWEVSERRMDAFWRLFESCLRGEGGLTQGGTKRGQASRRGEESLEHLLGVPRVQAA